jgi:hypothetical protein
MTRFYTSQNKEKMRMARGINCEHVRRVLMHGIVDTPQFAARNTYLALLAGLSVLGGHPGCFYSLVFATISAHR